MNKSSELDIISFQKSLLPLRAKDRVAAIINRPDAMTIARQLPAQDLFITIKEVGQNDCLELLELLSPDQIKAFLDLDGWSHDRLDPKTIGAWLESLFAANQRRAVQIFRDLDVELISLLLKLYSHVYDIAAEEEPDDLSVEHSITPDRRYVVAFHADATEQNLIHFLKQALEQLYERDMSFALRLIEGVRWETASMLEEEALKWRDGRMQDMGFSSIDEAKDILAYVEPTQFQKHPQPSISPALSAQSTSPLLHGIKSHTLFGKALRDVSEETRQRVMSELVTVSNRVHVAMAADLGDTDALFETVSHTVNTVEIALSYLSQGDEAHLSRGLIQFPLQRLFQIGRSLALRIGRDFRKVIADPNSGLDGNGLLRLDSPLAEVAAGVLRTDPVYFAGLSDPKRIDYRRFENLKNIAQTAAAVAEAVFRAYLLGPRGIGAPDQENHTHGVLLATWLCRLLIDGEATMQSFDQNDLNRLRSRMESVGEGRRFALGDVTLCKNRVVELAEKLVPSPSIKTKEEAQQRASQYTQVVLGIVENELSRIQDENIDPRYISSLLVRNESDQ